MYVGWLLTIQLYVTHAPDSALLLRIPFASEKSGFSTAKENVSAFKESLFKLS